MIAIEQWHKPKQVSSVPWQYLPHLHPCLEQNERKVDTENEQGSLFLENAIQMHPDTCLIFLIENQKFIKITSGLVFDSEKASLPNVPPHFAIA